MKNFTILALFGLSTLAAPALLYAESPMMCTMQYDPVCGTKDGVYKTYGNGCVLGNEGATYQHAGECTAAELNGSASARAYVPPAHCTAWFDGCNSCGRGENGMAYCTLKACMGEPRAGYCTAYSETEIEPAPEDPAPVSDQGTSRPDTSPEADAPLAVEATSSAAISSSTGFFLNIWIALKGWFNGLF